MKHIFPPNCAIVFRIHPPKRRKNNALFCCFQLRNMLKNPCWKKATRIDMMLETLWFFDRELKRDPYIWKVGRGWETGLKLFVGLSFWAPHLGRFGPLILDVLTPLGLVGPSWPFESFYPVGLLLVFWAPIDQQGPSWSLRYNLDVCNHMTNSLRSYYWLFGYVDFLGVARQVLLLTWKIVDICTSSGLFSSCHVGFEKSTASLIKKTQKAIRFELLRINPS